MPRLYIVRPSRHAHSPANASLAVASRSLRRINEVELQVILDELSVFRRYQS